MLDSDGIRAELDELTGGEAWEVRHRYEVLRRRQDGQHQDVEVLISYRSDVGWLVTATDTKRGLSATGNPDHDLQATLHTVHWHELEGP